MTRGYFEVGIYHGKSEVNIGTLLRSAYQLGAAGVFTVGRRYKRQSSDTYKAWRHIPLRHFADIGALVEALPYSCPLVGVEMGGEPLEDFAHPERAAYLLGAEDHGLPEEALAECHSVVRLNASRVPSYNVAVAGSLVMYHRQFWGRTARGEG